MTSSFATIPGPQAIEDLVNCITAPMLGMHFSLADPATKAEVQRRVALLPLHGSNSVFVAVSCDDHGCAKIGTALFKCAAAELDAAMMDDTMRELANMVGGLARSAMRLKEALGLPQLLAPGSVLPPSLAWRHFQLSCGKVQLVVSLALSGR